MSNDEIPWPELEDRQDPRMVGGLYGWEPKQDMTHRRSDAHAVLKAATVVLIALAIGTALVGMYGLMEMGFSQ